MWGCGRTSRPVPARSTVGPIWSKNTNGPTMRRWRLGSARRTRKPLPRSCVGGTITTSILGFALIARFRIGDRRAAYRWPCRCMDGGHLYRLTLRVCSCGKAESKAKHNAAALILAHNHPSGVAEPTQADDFETRCLREALQLVDIRVLDLRRARAVIGVGSEISAPLLRVRRK